jgi:hypothetical protein
LLTDASTIAFAFRPRTPTTATDDNAVHLPTMGPLTRGLF